MKFLENTVILLFGLLIGFSIDYFFMKIFRGFGKTLDERVSLILLFIVQIAFLLFVIEKFENILDDKLLYFRIGMLSSQVFLFDLFLRKYIYN
ncbi:067R [Cherax quadricarinatus iridovirus]|uniref:Spore cortex biosynthesis protein YabQ n=1 Tax=Shrimp hemocyte iridescent virus TaxID=2039780 RepID=A0A291B0S2_9VIRU|nr:067R [Cherax quadricarinatus iridovirus]YP_010084836.1 hypothetical protein KM509_gp084 [Shrimp hemocyte iridescent virus]ASZ85047.1 067R [Cherax quadricarinatus iridovirus]ATE87093.1 hypothetical protein [Shrimp hemocyte iridescent virus]